MSTRGRVKSVHLQAGYGIVTPLDGSEDIKLSAKDFQAAGITSPYQGQLLNLTPHGDESTDSESKGKAKSVSTVFENAGVGLGPATGVGGD